MLNSVIFSLLIAQSFAVGRSLPWGLLPFDLGRLFWFFLTIGFVLGIFLRKTAWVGCFAGLTLKSWALRAWLALNLVYLWMSYSRFRQMGYAFPWLPVAAVCLGTLFIERAPGAKGWRGRLIFAFAINLLILVGSIFHFPIHPLRSDMLPVIANGLDFWAGGVSPYEVFELAGRSNRMGYLPGTLFFNLPAWALGLDLRWNTFFYRVIWMFLVVRRLDLSKKPEKSSLVWVWLALAPYFNFRHDLYFEGFILGVVALVLYPRLRFVLVPALVATRQWAWVLAPFWLLIECFGPTRRIVWKRVLVSVLAWAAIMALFVALLSGSTKFGDFWRVIFWFQKAVNSTQFSGDYGLTFAPLFYRFEVSSWLQKTQALVLGGCFLAAFKVRGDSARVLRLSALAWVLFTFLNGHYWLYFWNTLVVYLAALSICEESSATQSGSPAGPAQST